MKAELNQTLECIYVLLLALASHSHGQVIDFELQASNVTEGDPSVIVCVELISGPISTGIEVLTIISTGGTATDGLDYFSTTSTLTFLIGTQPGDLVCSSIVIADDQLVENTESFDVHVSSTVPSSTVHFPNGTYSSIFILDNDQAIVCFTQPVYQQNENNSPLVAALVIVSGILTLPVTVQVQTEEIVGQPDVATEGIDYQPFNQNLTFSAGSSPGAQQHIMVSLFDDNDAENVESFNFQATPQSSQVGFAPCGQQAVGQIIDNDPVEFELQTSNIREGDPPGSVPVCVELISGQILTEVEVVTISTGGTATDGLDYFSTTATLTFVIGTQPGEPRSRLCSSIVIADDQLVENTESFDVHASSNVLLSAVHFPNGLYSSIFIFDNDQAIFRFTQPVYQQNENNSPLVAALELVSGILTFPVTVQVQTEEIVGQPDAATEGIDYQPFNQNLTLSAGSSPGAQQHIMVPLFDENIAENGESFNFQATPQSTQVGFAPCGQQALGQIIDNDVCQFGFEQSSSTVIEGPGNTTEEVCLIKLSTGTPFLIDAVTVEISTTIGTKTAGLDYLPFSTVVTFLPGVTRHCVNLTLLDDDCVESLECIEIDATSGNTSLLQVVPNLVPNQDFSEVCCSDDDTITVRLVPPSGSVMPEYTVNEGDGVLRVGVEVIGGQLKRTVTVVVNTHDGSPGPCSAQSYFDYFPVINYPLRFNATSGRILFVPITVYDDLFCEGDETFFISLSTFDPAVTIDPTANNGTINIDDNEIVTAVSVQIETDQSSYSVREGDTLHIDIELGGQTGLGRDCIVTIVTVDGTAILPYTISPHALTLQATGRWKDYSAIPPTLLTFNDTNVLESVYIYTFSDSRCYEGNEEFEIHLSTSSPGCTIRTDTIPVTIIDKPVTREMGDDPHFSIALPSGKLFCYAVQGEHGFSFNLISNKKMVTNAKFVPDARRPEVTWLGSIGIVLIAQHSNHYEASRDTKLRFEAHDKNIYIDSENVVLEAKNVEKLTFSHGQLDVSEASEGHHNLDPSVHVDLEDFQFTIKFTNQHLDIDWHTTEVTGPTGSYGLHGQFFGRGVEVTQVRKCRVFANTCKQNAYV